MNEAIEIRQGFIVDRLPERGTKVEVLCEYEGRSAVLALLCSWSDDGWIVVGTRRRLDYQVLGWRPAPLFRKR